MPKSASSHHPDLSAATAGPFTLPELPYATNALSPHISSETLKFHYDKHHRGYVEKVNKLVADSKYASKSLEEIILDTAQNPQQKELFNNAAQSWNHDFFWHSMQGDGGSEPRNQIADMIEDDFGSFDIFRTQFIEAGMAQFGSGWVWLVLDKDGQLLIKTTGNADLPMASGEKALLTADVWEHAYYLDYQNRRKDFLTVFIDKLANWQFAEHNLQGHPHKLNPAQPQFGQMDVA